MTGHREDDVRAVHVVVPAHDEELLLAGCLASVTAATAEVRTRYPSVEVGLLVVLDSCTDGSADVCAGAGIECVEVGGRNVGAARRAGVEHVLRRAADGRVAPAHTWIACTDADSRVPVGWLAEQVAIGSAGADVVLGRVEPDPTGPAEVVARWHELHGDGRVGLHGAHLGFRLSSYVDVGGFTSLPVREDLDLYQRLLATGARYGAAAEVVTTSSRLEGRVRGGYADFLASLSTSPGPRPAG